MTKKYNPLEYWGELAIKLSEDIKELKEMIVIWGIMLNSPDFNDTDAEIVRKEMGDLINCTKD